MKFSIPFLHAKTDAKALKHGAYASVLTAAVVVAVVLLNLVVRALPSQYTDYDISLGAIFTLSDQTKTLLSQLDREVEVYYLAQTGQEDENITRLLERYAGKSGSFRWQQRDPVLYPTFAQQYSNAAAGSLIVTCGENYEILNYYGDLYEIDYDAYYTSGVQQYSLCAENALTAAVSKVLRTERHRLYELTGHGETALGTDFVETLENGGVEVQTLNLLTAGAVPADAAAVLLNAPLSDLTAEEAVQLADYMANGGDLLLCTDFTVQTPQLDSLAAQWGLHRQEGLLVETDADCYPYGFPSTYLLPRVNGSEITAGVAEGRMVYLPIAQGILHDESSGYTYTELLTTSEGAYSMLGYATAETAVQGPQDPTGPFAPAVAAYDPECDAHFVWINCPNALMSNINQSVAGGNAQLLGGILNWCTGAQTTAVIASKSLSAEYLNVPATAAVGLGVLFTIVLPLVCLVGGAVVCMVRRRR